MGDFCRRSLLPYGERTAASTSWGSPSWQRGSGKVWVCALSPSGRREGGRHGSCCSPPPLCQPAGFKSVRVRWSEIRAQVPGSSKLQGANPPALLSHGHHRLASQPQLPHLPPGPGPRHAVTRGHPQLPLPAPAPPCPAQGSAQGVIGEKRRAHRAPNPIPPAMTWWDPWFRGTKKALTGPTSQIQGACTSCSTCGTTEERFVLSSLQKGTVHFWLSIRLGSWALPASQVPLLPPQVAAGLPKGQASRHGQGARSSQARAEPQRSEPSPA